MRAQTLVRTKQSEKSQSLSRNPGSKTLCWGSQVKDKCWNESTNSRVVVNERLSTESETNSGYKGMQSDGLNKAAAFYERLKTPPSIEASAVCFLCSLRCF